MGVAHERPFEVMVWMPDVAEKVTPPAPPPKDIAEESVISPKHVSDWAAGVHVPLNAVEKFKDLKKFGEVRMYDPEIILNEKTVVSVVAPEAIVVATAPELSMLTLGVPEMVRLVAVAVVQIVPPAVLLQVMFPVPNAMLRTPLPVDEKSPVVKEKLFKLMVPLVNVQVRAATRVRLS